MWNPMLIRKLRQQLTARNEIIENMAQALADARKREAHKEHAITNLLSKKSLLEEDLRRTRDRLRKALQGDDDDEESPDWLLHLWRKAQGPFKGLPTRPAMSGM